LSTTIRAGSALAHGKTASLSTRSGTVTGGGGGGEDEGNRMGVLAVQPANRIREKRRMRVANINHGDFTDLIIKKNATACNFLFYRDVVQCQARHRAIFFSLSAHR
jgi:hypothetical protein